MTSDTQPARVRIREGPRSVATRGRASDRFTGKEEDVEVGLVYFGKRFYAPLLGRWVSPDPLAIHEPGEADLNLYAYVSGQALRAIDPLGLQSIDEADAGAPTDAGIDSDSPPGGTGPPEYVNQYSGQQASQVAHHFQTKAEQVVTGLKDAGKGTIDGVIELQAAVLKHSMMPMGVHDADAVPGAQTIDAAADSVKLGGTSAEYEVGKTGAKLATLALTLPQIGSGIGWPSTFAHAGKGRLSNPGVGLADLPQDVAVPIQTGTAGAMAMPRELTAREMAALMNTTGGVEFSQSLQLSSGTYLLTRGARSNVEVFAGPGYRWLGHTHPGGTGPSGKDMKVMRDLSHFWRTQHESSIYLPSGAEVRYGPLGPL